MWKKEKRKIVIAIFKYWYKESLGPVQKEGSGKLGRIVTQCHFQGNTFSKFSSKNYVTLTCYLVLFITNYYEQLILYKGWNNLILDNLLSHRLYLIATIEIYYSIITNLEKQCNYG